MKCLKLALGLLLVVAGALAVAVAPAMAEPKEARWVICVENAGMGHWENNLCTKAKSSGNWETKAVTEHVPITATSEKIELIDKDKGEPFKITCRVTEKGWVGAEGATEISSATFTECKRVEGKTCASPSVKAAGLSYFISLLLGFSAVGSRFLLTFSGKGPAYVVDCGLEAVDECIGPMGGEAINVNGTVVLQFGVEDEEKQECKLGGTGSGEIKGNMVLKQENGHGLIADPI